MQRHGVVVVHGQGTDRVPGTFLDGVSSTLVQVLERQGGFARRRTERDAAGRFRSIIQVQPPARAAAEAHCYEFIEAFWDDRFPAPGRERVVSWALKSAFLQVKHSFALLLDPANDNRGKDGAPSAERWSGRAVRAIYAVQLVLLAAVLVIGLALALPILLLVTFLLALDSTPGIRLFGFWRGVANALRTLDPFLTQTMGDSQRLVEDAFWSAAARGAIEAVVIDLLARDDIDDISIIAHSAGCGVVYDALLEGSLIGDAFASADHHEVDFDCGWSEQRVLRRKKLTFISLGNAVNRFGIAAGRADPGFARRFIDLPIDHRIVGEWDGAAPNPFFWLDLYARLDPVPGGRLRNDVQVASKLPPALMKSRQVLNFDNPLADHGAYFTNRHLVVPRIIRSISGGEYPWPPVDEGPTPPPAINRDAEAVGPTDWTFGGAVRRVRLLARLQVLRLAIALAIAAHAVLWLSTGWRSALESLFDRLNDFIGWLVQDLPLLDEAWKGGATDLADSLGIIGAIALPAVLLLAIQQLIRRWFFAEL